MRINMLLLNKVKGKYEIAYEIFFYDLSSSFNSTLEEIIEAYTDGSFIAVFIFIIFWFCKFTFYHSCNNVLLVLKC